jgi:hypothetical protein
MIYNRLCNMTSKELIMRAPVFAAEYYYYYYFVKTE